MYTIRTLNNIAKTGLAKLPEQNFVIDEKAENPEGIILRSFDMHKMELNESLLAVARAGAGTNNIPIEKCTQKGVPVFNTPGANANAVKELVLAGLFASSRRIIAGAAWVQGLKDRLFMSLTFNFNFELFLSDCVDLLSALPFCVHSCIYSSHIKQLLMSSSFNYPSMLKYNYSVSIFYC